MLSLRDFCTNTLGPSCYEHDISAKVSENPHLASARPESAQHPEAIVLNEKRSVGGEWLLISSNRMSKK